MDSSTKTSFESIKSFLNLQLYKDYDHILYSYRVKMLKPFIKVDSLESFYGSWCEKTRTITLSEKLIENYPWDLVLEVLKHEMAHQYVSEVLLQQEAHGSFFKEACQILRVKEWAQRACLSLDSCLLERERNFSKSSGESSSLRRVKKLLSLGKSSNKNEALLALKKASEIARDHQIDLENLGQEASYKALTIKFGRKKIYSYESLMASFLVSHFRVKVVHSSLFNKDSLREEKTLELVGEAHHVDMGEYVFFFLKSKLEHLWKERTNKGKGMKAKHDFYFGVLDGLCEQLDQESQKEKQSVSERESGLIFHEKEKKLQDYAAYLFPRVSSSQSRSHSVSEASYREGMSEGRKLKIRQPLSKKALLKIGA